MAAYDDRDMSHTQFMQTTSLVNYAGAAVSLALVVGVSIWGYQLIVRDVSGIPVVRAAEGAMRVAPQDAGGEIADHAGLSVNEVIGEGEAAGPADSLLLAPQRAALAAEDLRVQPTAEAGEVLPTAGASQAAEVEVQTALELGLGTENSAPMTTEELLQFADQVAATATPLTPLAEGEAVAPTVALDGAVVSNAVQFLDASVPGLAKSLRPTVRPASLVVTRPAVAQTVTASADALPDTTSAVAAALAEVTQLAAAPVLAPGTHLVQLGAYETTDEANAEWTRIQGRFAEFMTGKEMVVQEAESAGTTFYRLRASGFGEAVDARRFCAALNAGNADCIPVVVQ